MFIINATHSSGSFIIHIFRLRAGTDGHETFQDKGCEVLTLDPGLLTIYKSRETQSYVERG
jgi:hypothetical protein